MNDFSAYFKKLASESTEYIIVFAVAILSYFIIKKVLIKILNKLFEKTENNYDDILMESNVFGQLAFIAPALVFIYSSEFIHLSKHVTQIISAYIALNITIFLIRLFTDLNKIYNEFDISARRPIKGYIQMAQVIIGFLGLIITVCLAIGKSPVGILSGLGAISAVLMFVFKDTIMSFVAGLQIMINDLVHKGDWIEMSTMGADGMVEDIALYTIKVRNFDNTIVTIPTSKLIEQSFKNWRGMKESGVRRIKRSMYIDMSTVRFLDFEMIQRFESIDLLKDYMASKRAEGYDMTGKDINKPSLTNIGTFRTYIFEYLKSNPNIRKDLTLIVRQLNPTPEGFPIEIYVFADTIDWALYENIQSDIFDHLTAVAGFFDLRLFQHPSGYDFSKLHSSS